MEKEKLFKPKFKVGDVVWLKDEYSFNPENKVIRIGRIEGIHVYKGKSFFSRRTLKGTFEQEDLLGRITYTISGFSHRPCEEELRLFKGEV